MRDYARIGIEPFGAHLLDTGDLDPVYVALNGAGYSDGQKLRWLVAYCALYHCGSACWLSEQEGSGFWRWLDVAAKDEAPAPTGGRWPRGHERRYFYRAQAEGAVADWRAKYGDRPEDMMAFIRGAGGGESAAAVMARARTHRSVGNWLAFKMADLVDACLGAEVDQTDLAPFLYSTPRESLLSVWRERRGQECSDDEAVVRMMEDLRASLSGHVIPHKPSVTVPDNFVLETVACKHGSHRSGFYALYTDTVDIHHGLSGWRKHSASAEQFAAVMPRMPEWRLC